MTILTQLNLYISRTLSVINCSCISVQGYVQNKKKQLKHKSITNHLKLDSRPRLPNGQRDKNLLNPITELATLFDFKQKILPIS